jgi:hypothetical protein
MVRRLTVAEVIQNSGVKKTTRDERYRNELFPDADGLVFKTSDQMATYYKGIGFIECPAGPRKLMMSIQAVRLSVAG